MRIFRRTPLLAVGIVVACTAPSAAAAPPAQPGNCVSFFTTTLGHAGVNGQVISSGAQDPTLHPFGKNAVSQQAHAALGSCPFNPEDFLGP
jgi:hypothetical protein